MMVWKRNSFQTMGIFGGRTLLDMEPKKGWVVDVLPFPTGLFSHSMFGFREGRMMAMVMAEFPPEKKKKHEVGMEVSKLLFCLRVRKCMKN